MTMSLVTMSILHWANESNLFDGLNNENLNLKQTYYNIWKQFGVYRKHEYQCIKSNKVIYW